MGLIPLRLILRRRRFGAVAIGGGPAISGIGRPVGIGAVVPRVAVEAGIGERQAKKGVVEQEIIVEKAVAEASVAEPASPKPAVVEAAVTEAISMKAGAADPAIVKPAAVEAAAVKTAAATRRRY